MNNKSKFILGGMALGGAAFAAFKKLDSKKQKQIINKAASLTQKLKQQAVDYTLYLDDTINNAKENLDDKTRDARNKAENVASKATEQAKNAAEQVENKVNNIYLKTSKKDVKNVKNNESSTQFHTATDHLRLALKDSDQNDDIILNDQNLSFKQPTIIFYPDGTSKAL